MSDASAMPTADAQSEANNKLLFWACFVSLITTAFGFIIRALIVDELQATFVFNQTQKGALLGVGLWPFAISIILFSLVIDRIGYKPAMYFAFFCHLLSAIVTIVAPNYFLSQENLFLAYWSLYFGTLIVALGNGTVEAVINPVVATLFPTEKTKWLNILHAGWPGGLVLAGVILISVDNNGWIANIVNAGKAIPWEAKVALIMLPTLSYGIMLLFCTFPVSERVAAGVSYRDMLREFGMGGALIVGFLIYSEMAGVVVQLSGAEGNAATAIEIGRWSLLALTVVGFGHYIGYAIGRPLFLFLLLIMIPLATTELGTDSWISSLMRFQMERAGAHAGWVLVYTSFIMMILRFFAGPIVHRLSPLGLLAGSSVIAIIGLFFLSVADSLLIIFLAATVYGFGKTFFWPTMLGVVAEQSPKGGALTLNATGGVGMLGAGLVGAVLLGYIQDTAVERAMRERPEVHSQLVKTEKWAFGEYNAIDAERVKTLPEEERAEVKRLQIAAETAALAKVTIFPAIMLVCFIALIIYFNMKGGYQAEVLVGHAAEDEKFTGGVEGPVE